MRADNDPGSSIGKVTGMWKYQNPYMFIFKGAKS